MPPPMPGVAMPAVPGHIQQHGCMPGQACMGGAGMPPMYCMPMLPMYCWWWLPMPMPPSAAPMNGWYCGGAWCPSRAAA